MDRLARIGLVCRGVLYGLIGVLAVQIAFGDGGRQADKNGAISTVAALPFGAVILWIMVVGFAALILWQASEAIFGSHGLKERIEPVSRVVVYAFVCTALLTTLLAGRTRSDDQKSQDVTGKLLALPAGQVIVGVIGLGVVALGLYWVRYGVKKEFRKQLRPMPPRARSVMDRLGLAGYLARGVIAVLAGVFVIQAAITFDPGKAGGIDATLRAFADTPAGPWLLAVVAAGLVLFAGYCFGETRWRRI
jgi:amino acid transporter